jgi:hypothetical protein
VRSLPLSNTVNSSILRQGLFSSLRRVPSNKPRLAQVLAELHETILDKVIDFYIHVVYIGQVEQNEYYFSIDTLYHPNVVQSDVPVGILAFLLRR